MSKSNRGLLLLISAAEPILSANRVALPPPPVSDLHQNAGVQFKSRHYSRLFVLVVMFRRYDNMAVPNPKFLCVAVCIRLSVAWREEKKQLHF